MNIGDKLINFKLLSTNGEWYSNFAFADKYALCIIFTCNSCEISKAYWSRIIKLFDQYEEDSMAVVAINSNDASQQSEDSYEEMKKQIKRMQHENFMYLHDADQVVARQMGATKNPEVFLFNSKRELVYKGVIDDNWENETQVMMAYLEDAIEYCLDGIDIDYPELPAVGCDIIWKK